MPCVSESPTVTSWCRGGSGTAGRPGPGAPSGTPRVESVISGRIWSVTTTSGGVAGSRYSAGREDTIVITFSGTGRNLNHQSRPHRPVLSLDEDQVGDVAGQLHGLPIDRDHGVESGRVRIGDHIQPVVVAGQEGHKPGQGDVTGAEG